ncbi:MAG TPA: DUF4251 domain-containing protein [Prolixibacteraceae bacterium]|nr:DUF4251 domain-containing protein [Prolixibacteraceae bacterium]
MKTISFIILGILFIIISGFQPGERKLRKVQKEREMLELLESGKFRFVARSARSSLGNFNNLSTHYDLDFDSLNIKAFLPYYGRAYSVPYNGEGGVKFDLKADKIEKRWDKKKKRYIVATEVSDQHDSYSIYMTASLSGYADVLINFRNRQMISYYGILERLNDE